MHLVDALAGEQVADLADGVDRHARTAQLVEVRPARGREREVTPSPGALEGAGLAAEGPRDDAPDGVLAVHDPTRRGACRVQLRLGHAVDVRGQLRHGVLRRVEDHAAVAQRLGAVVADHRQAVVGAVADEAQGGRPLERGDDVVGEAVWVGRKRRRRDRAHELPVAAGRILAVTLRREPSVQRGRGGRRYALQRQDAAQPEAPEHG